MYLGLQALVRGTGGQLDYEALWVEWNSRGLTGFESNTWILVYAKPGVLGEPDRKAKDDAGDYTAGSR